MLNSLASRSSCELGAVAALRDRHTVTRHATPGATEMAGQGETAAGAALTVDDLASTLQRMAISGTDRPFCATVGSALKAAFPGKFRCVALSMQRVQRPAAVTGPPRPAQQGRSGASGARLGRPNPHQRHPRLAGRGACCPRAAKRRARRCREGALEHARARRARPRTRLTTTARARRPLHRRAPTSRRRETASS